MFLNDIIQKYQNNIATISHDGRQMTYGEMLSFSNKLYDKIGHRCLVFCLCQNNIESLIGYISFLSNRVVPLMLDASLNDELLNSLIESYKPKYLWMPSNMADSFTNCEIVYSFEQYSLLKYSETKSFSLFDDLALLLTTSGSTGSPKLVRLSYDNIQANATSIRQYLSLTENERPITALPMSYSFGLSIINSHMLCGATLLLTSKSLMEKEFWSLLKNEKATSLSGVPYTFEILKKLRFFRMELPHLKTITQAGGKLNIELNKEFAEYCQNTNKCFFVMYGQTEATARMSYLDPNFAITKLGSMGKAIPGGKFKLIDENQNIIEVSDIAGELVYEGKNVSLGYAECGDDLNKGDENNGILYTGDIAKRDNDGFYYIVGRKKRFIKLFGNRINLDETERLLKNIITDCACVGDDDKMIIYITDSAMQSDVKDFITHKTGINSIAFSVKVIDTIPKNSSGKTIYTNLSLS